MLKTAARSDDRKGDHEAVAKIVDQIVSDVASNGDAAVRRHSLRLDGWEPQSFRLGPDEISASLGRVPTQVLEDIAFCQEQVRRFAQAQRATMVDLEIETLPGVRLGHQAHSGRERRCVCARRPVSDGRLGAHEHRHGEGRGR